MSTDVIDDFIVAPTYGALGNALGGVVELNGGIEDPIRGGSVGVNMVLSSASVSIPGESSWVTGSLRRAYADLYESGSDQFPDWPTFTDYYLQAGNAWEHFKLSMTLIGAQDSYSKMLVETDSLTPLERSENGKLEFGRRFDSGGLTLSHDGDFHESTTTVAAVFDRWDVLLE